MIIVDTHVVSEPMKTKPHPAVRTWLDRQAPETLFLTTINLAELLTGMAVLPAGKRRRGMQAAFEALLRETFESRILPFDEAAARAHSPLRAHARAQGRSVSVADGYIATIASVHGFAVATRDGQPFAAFGVAVIDPWTA